MRRGLVGSRTEAAGLIAARRVLVGGAFAEKAARLVAAGDPVEVMGPPARFVGRGGDKLAGALDGFGIDPTGRSCLDAGSSTGGFTDCLLQRGARRVVAVDVGRGQLDPRLREDARVVALIIGESHGSEDEQAVGIQLIRDVAADWNITELGIEDNGTPLIDPGLVADLGITHQSIAGDFTNVSYCNAAASETRGRQMVTRRAAMRKQFDEGVKTIEARMKGLWGKQMGTIAPAQRAAPPLLRPQRPSTHPAVAPWGSRGTVRRGGRLLRVVDTADSARLIHRPRGDDPGRIRVVPAG